ncbi:MAG: hypothetical protein LC115_10645 [Bacteroidia bacterium]|nr:hypothetical protein [Bacteroidia bacterium]
MKTIISKLSSGVQGEDVKQKLTANLNAGKELLKTITDAKNVEAYELESKAWRASSLDLLRSQFTQTMSTPYYNDYYSDYSKIFRQVEIRNIHRPDTKRAKMQILIEALQDEITFLESIIKLF